MKPTTREVIACLKDRINVLRWLLPLTRRLGTPEEYGKTVREAACLKRAIAIVRASAGVKASRKGRARK